MVVDDETLRRELETITGLTRKNTETVGKLVTVVDQLMKAVESMAKGRFNGGSSGGGSMATIVAVAAIIGGLMGPMYIMHLGTAQQTKDNTALMRIDDNRERVAAAESARRDGALTLIVKEMDIDNTREEGDIAEFATLKEKVRALELAQGIKKGDL